MALTTNKQKMLAGEQYVAFTPELIVERQRCKAAVARFNNSGALSRRQVVELWRAIVGDETPLPPMKSDLAADEAVLDDEPVVETPVRMDYGYNVRIAKNAFINSSSTFIDTCPIIIGSRTLVGPNVSFYSGTHPLDPFLRNGTKGPETGKDIVVGEDCWIGGHAIILPGVTLGRGVVIGAGSVVTKDVPEYHVAAGNPARIIRKIEISLDPHA